MDPFTHALAGAIAARSMRAPSAHNAVNAPLRPWHVVLVVTLSAVFPDIDALLGFFSDIATLTDRRGVTHSLVLLPIWAMLLGWLFSRILKRPERIWHFVGLAAMGIGLHLFFDLINAFGVMLLAPLSWRRFDWGITFIVDLTLTSTLLVGIVCAIVWRSKRAGRVIALTTAAVTAAYLLLQVGAKQIATQHAVAYAKASGLDAASAAASAAALPRQLSPFHWTLIVQTNEGFALAHVDLLRITTPVASADDGFFMRIQNAFGPVSEATWQSYSRYGGDATTNLLARPDIVSLWRDPAFAFFRDFAAYPALISTSIENDRRCANFEDLRFVAPARENHPFRYGICRLTNQRVVIYAITDEAQLQPVNRTTRLLF